MIDILEKFPQQGNYRRDIGIAICSSVGSNISQDTGRVAQELADRFNVLGLAVNRIGNQLSLAEAFDIAVDGVHASHTAAKRIANMIQGWGVRSLVLAGQSAGGLQAIELGLTGEIPTPFIYASEPVAWFDTTPKEGFKAFKEYQQEQARIQAADLGKEQRDWVHPYNDGKDLPLGIQVIRGISIARQFGTDRLMHGNHWNQALMPRYLARLAAFGIQTHVDIAEHSMVTDGSFKPTEIGRKVICGIVEHTTHASFDSRDFFGARLQATALHEAGIDLA